MEPRLTSDVEKISGRTVIAFMSENHIDPDMAIENFVLAPPDADNALREAA